MSELSPWEADGVCSVSAGTNWATCGNVKRQGGSQHVRPMKNLNIESASFSGHEVGGGRATTHPAPNFTFQDGSVETLRVNGQHP